MFKDYLNFSLVLNNAINNLFWQRNIERLFSLVILSTNLLYLLILGAYFIILYQDNAYARLRHLTENDRFTEKKVAIPELLEIIVKQKNDEQSSNSGPTGSTVGGPITRIGKSFS